jgi:hypothetical protein
MDNLIEKADVNDAGLDDDSLGTQQVSSFLNDRLFTEAFFLALTSSLL